MKYSDPEFLVQSRGAFLADTLSSLQHVREQIVAHRSGTVRRDALSALDTLARVFSRDLSTVLAVPKSIRELLASKTAAELGLSDKRYANVRSSVVSSVRTFGRAPHAITRRVPTSPAWKELLDQIDSPVYRNALNRLAAFCSSMNLSPQQARPEVLLGFFEALDAEEAVKHPRRIIKHTIAIWNICHRTVPGWPDIRLGSPFERDVVSLPLVAFPKSFQEDLERWCRRMTDPDILDASAPARPLRASTVESRTRVVVRFASALVHAGALKIDDVTGLHALVDVERFKTGIRFFLERLDKRPTDYLHNMANAIPYIAIHYCRVDEAARAELARICKRLDDRKPHQLTPRNRERLRQFDDPWRRHSAARTRAAARSSPACPLSRGTFCRRHGSGPASDRSCAGSASAMCRRSGARRRARARNTSRRGWGSSAPARGRAPPEERREAARPCPRCWRSTFAIIAPSLKGRRAPTSSLAAPAAPGRTAP
jgi:hypothetical protein